MVKWLRYHCVFFINIHILYIQTYLLHLPSLTLILSKATEVTDGMWQRVMRTCGDKKSICNGASKPKEDESALVNTMDNPSCSFIINDHANTSLRDLVIKMKTMHIYESSEEWSEVVLSVRIEIVVYNINTLVKAFNDALGFSKSSLSMPVDMGGEGEMEKRIGEKW